MIQMKRKMLAAIAASAVLFSVMTAAASAAAYKKGDVDMDGKITAADAQLALIDYTEYLVAGNNHALPKEQLALADVCRTTTAKESGTPEITVHDAHAILVYYTESVADDAVREQDIAAYLTAHFSWYVP